MLLLAVFLTNCDNILILIAALYIADIHIYSYTKKNNDHKYKPKQ